MSPSWCAGRAFQRQSLKRVGPGFPGTDAHRLADVDDEDLAVADLFSIGSVADGFQFERLYDGHKEFHGNRSLHFPRGHWL